jgi:geranylgeranyl diphosphate synthase type II
MDGMSPNKSPETFLDRCDVERIAVEKRCADLVEFLASDHAGLAESISYSLLGGGKRLRPIMCLWTHDLVGGNDRDAALDAASALECVHTYSLIHDDLPCMDDDDFRRGKQSSHKKFGEATALLTGDALLTLAFGILSTIPERFPSFGNDRIVEITRVLAEAAGTSGMITGQVLDLEATGKKVGEAAVQHIHRNKTAKMISASMEVGAVMGGCADDLRLDLRRAGLLAGEAFQIVDDILDLEADRETLGKTPGKDLLDGKPTYPSVVGVEQARSRARALIEEAKSILPEGKKSFILRSLLDYFVARVS